jgi:hypothetical protein
MIFKKKIYIYIYFQIAPEYCLYFIIIIFKTHTYMYKIFHILNFNQLISKKVKKNNREVMSCLFIYF